MKTLFPEAKTIQQAKRQIAIMERATTLLEDGYTFTRSEKFYFIYAVRSPEGKFYGVDTRFGKCDCKSFEHDGDCKHRIGMAVYEQQEMWNALCAEHDAQEANDEGPDSSNGGGWNW